MLRMIASLAVTALLIQLGIAANYTVGGPNGGWDTSTNLQSWASGQTFMVGDNLSKFILCLNSIINARQIEYGHYWFLNILGE